METRMHVLHVACIYSQLFTCRVVCITVCTFIRKINEYKLHVHIFKSLFLLNKTYLQCFLTFNGVGSNGPTPRRCACTEALAALK